MRIIAHRGFWRQPNEQNSLRAFLRAINHGFGIELDIWQRKNELVVSHDVPKGRWPKLRDIFATLAMSENLKKIPVAINIKSDGLEKAISSLLHSFDLKENSFVFDMSVPSLFVFSKLRKRVYFATRHSDIEKKPIFYKEAKWVWMDELVKSWITPQAIASHIDRAKAVCIVSPELHSRPFMAKWKQYLSLPKDVLNKLYLCTDFPERANNFFNREANS
jgi:glycerophosphoryl diester phosphodiesterase